MTKKSSIVIAPTTGTITSEKTLAINDSDIVEAEVIEDWGDNHPNFIESNTQAITLDELTNKNVIPTFVDGTLTLSHQNFIGAVRSVAEKVFGELTPVESAISSTQESKRIDGRRQDHLLSENGILLSCQEPYQTNQWANSSPLHRWSESL